MENTKPKLPAYKVFSKGVLVVVWDNEIKFQQDGTPMTRIVQNIEIKNTYKDKQGMRQTKPYFDIESLPLLIMSLQDVYARYNIKRYVQGEFKDIFL